MYVMGIDLGTGGARVLICDNAGNLIALSHEELKPCETSSLPPGYHEQHSEDWWRVTCGAIRGALKTFKEKGFLPSQITALSVTSTSGTILPLDIETNALHSALMYNDNRAVVEAEEINQVASTFNQRHGRKFNASYALAKILWMKRNHPDLFSKTRYWVHASDYLIGKISGNYSISDYSNALKTGYDLFDFRWTDIIERELGIPLGTLPHVVAPGDVIGNVSGRCANETGLSEVTLVCAGMTDSTASLLATGAVKPGDWSSTMGTTLSIKGITEDLVHDQSGAVYCHRHPNGWWMPGAASNVGGEWLMVLYPDVNKTEMDANAGNYGVSNLVVYPLVRKGERFPFVNSKAEGFTIGEARHDIERYRGYMEGTGLVERLCYEVLEKLGAPVGEDIYISGGSTKSDVWSHIRADIMGKRLLKPELPESAMGAAILAASKTLFSDVVDAGKSMVRVVNSVEPDPIMHERYDVKYNEFIHQLKLRGYIQSNL